MLKELNKNELTNYKISKIFLPLYFILISIVIESFMSIFVSKTILPPYFILDFSFICIVATIFYLIGKRNVQFVLILLLTTLHLLLVLTNITMYDAFGDVFTFSFFYLINEAAKVFDFSFLKLSVVCFTILLLAINVLLSTFIFSKVKKYQLKYQPRYRRTKKKTSIIGFSWVFLALILPLIAINSSILSMKQANSDKTTNYVVLQNNDKYLYNNLVFRSNALKKFGTYTLYYREIMHNISNLFVDEIKLQESKKFIQSGSKSEPTWQASKAKDNNVLVIMLESTDYFALDKNLTPNLYNLYQGNNITVNDPNKKNKPTTLGTYTATNYYSKSKTNFSEISAMTGNAPYDGIQCKTWAMTNTNTMKNALNYSLPNLFSKANYKTRYFINHDINFFGRYNVMNKDVLGFDETYDILNYAQSKGYLNTFGDWYRDSEGIKYIKDKLFPNDEEHKDEKFFVWYTTLIPHGPYNGQVRDLEDNLKKIEELEQKNEWKNPFAYDQKLSYHYKNYISAVMDEDLAIGEIFEDLESKGKLDKTTILMFADHETYYYNIAQNYAKQIDPNRNNYYSDTLTYKLPFMVLNPNFYIDGKENLIDTKSSTSENISFSTPETPHTIDKFVDFFDVYATIVDLCGGHYNTNLCMGDSIFAQEDKNKILVSCTGGMLNDKFFSNDAESVIATAKEYSDEDVQIFLNAINIQYRKINHLNNIYSHQILKDMEINNVSILN